MNLKLLIKKIYKLTSKKPRLLILLKFSIIFLIFLYISWNKLDSDFGWHLKAGDYIRAHWIPQKDIFTYTAPNFRWINHEWGNDFLVSVFYAAGGYLLLSLLYSALWTSSLFIINSRARLLTLIIATSAIMPYAGIRVIAWTALLFAVLLRLLTSESKKLKYLIPLVFIIWVNLHGGFIAGFVLIAYYAAKRRDISLIYILVAAILVSFINPYGPRLYVEISRTIFDPSLHFQIAEWYYATIYNPTIPFIALWGAGFWIFNRKPLSNWLSLGPILLLASLSATRNVPLFVVATCSELDEYITGFVKELSVKSSRRNMRIRTSLILVVLGVLIVSIIYSSWGYVKNWNNRDAYYPKIALAYIKQHPCNGNFFADYNYGGYMIWQAPKYKVFIDGRMPSWKDENGKKYLDEYLNIFKTEDGYKSEFKKFNITCALLRNTDGVEKTISGLKKAGWKIVVVANGSILLVAPNSSS